MEKLIYFSDGNFYTFSEYRKMIHELDKEIHSRNIKFTSERMALMNQLERSWQP